MGCLKYDGMGTGNKAILNFVKHCERQIVSAICKGMPTEVTQHR